MDKLVTGTIFFLTFVTPSHNQTALSPSIAINQLPSVAVSSAPEFQTYSVASGNTLSSISERFYGSGKYWTSLWNDNDFISDPRIIKSGWSLKIRNNKPTQVEALTDNLQSIYEKIIAPTPTPTPTAAVITKSTSTTPMPLSSFDAIYQAAGSKFGIPWQILYGIHLTETGLRDGAISSGYGSGAQGPMQFLQQTFNSYATDGNGDGVPDINNAVDAIYTAANYLAVHGSIEAGLRSYGGDTQAIINAARSRGYNQ